MENLIEFSCVFSFVIGLTFLLFLMIGFPMVLIINHLKIKEFPIERDSLESDYIKALNMKTDFKQLSDILSTITNYNMKIKSMQYWNTVSVINWIIPDKWNDIKIIDIKEK